MIKFWTPTKLTLLSALAVTIVAGFVLVPASAELPVHWNLAGEADLFAPREVALLLPAAVVVVIWGIFLAVDRLAKPADREAGAYVTGAALTALTATFLGIAAATVAIGLGLPVSMLQVVAIAIGILLLVLGNAMPKSRPNSFAGIRMPTTLRSESNWLATHRLGGWLTLASGTVLLLAAALVPPRYLVWFIVGCVLLPMLTAALYSLLLARHAA